jgi:hypothetical protein
VLDAATSVVTGPNDGETVGDATSLVGVTGPKEAETAVEGVPMSVCPEVTAVSTGMTVVGSPVSALVPSATDVSTG